MNERVPAAIAIVSSIRRLTPERQLMTTGWGLSAGRLMATGGLFLRVDCGQWADESDDDRRTPPAPVR